MSVTGPWRADNLHLLVQSLLKFALEEPGNPAELNVNNILLQPLGVPQRQANTFPVDLGFEVVRSIPLVSRALTIVFNFVRRARGMLMRGES
jgi:hypothetical protein